MPHLPPQSISSPHPIHLSLLAELLLLTPPPHPRSLHPRDQLNTTLQQPPHSLATVHDPEAESEANSIARIYCASRYDAARVELSQGQR